MKRFLILLAALVCLTGCNEWDHEEIGLLGTSTRCFDNMMISLDKGWFVSHEDIVINYRDSVVVMPLKYVREAENIKVVR